MGRTDKLPPIPPRDSTLEGYVVNDESWETFLFALFPADNKPIDQSVKAGNGIRWGNLYAGLSSGHRARFSVLDKNELVSWAIDNHKVYDICKDVKTLVESSEKIPDALMAKLIKLWLLLSRAEGLDAKFGKLPSSDEAPEKKRDDRTRTPTLTKKPGSAKTPPSKSDAKGNDGTSERKDKLRDRVGGKTEKVQSVGDEPADGPDMYYALKDFDSVSVFSILQEEHSIQINAIITLLESNKTVDGSTNTTFLDLSKACEDSSDLSLWKNTLWTQLENAETTDAKELQDKIAAKIYSILRQRQVYEKFYGSEKFLAIPVIKSPKALRSELRYYDSILNSIRNQRAVTEDLILAVALEQLSRSTALEDEKLQDTNPVIPQEASEISQYFGNSMRKLAISLKTLKDNIVMSSPGNLTKIVKYGDLHSFGIQEASVLSLFDLDLEKLLLNIQSKFPMAKVQNIVAYALRRGLQDGFAAHRERILAQTELKRFSALPDETIQRGLLQLDFEDILSKKLGRELSINLNDWCWKEHLDKVAMVQVLQNAKLTHPNISTLICPREGSMLVTMMGSGKPFELKTVTNHSYNIKSKIGLSLFTRLNETDPNALSSSPNSIGYLAGDRITRLEQELTCLYPNNGAKIEISKLKMRAIEKVTGIYASNDISLSWSFDNKTSKSPYATLCLCDGTVLSVKKSTSSISIMLSTADGLVIDFLPGKKICQRISGFENINKEASEVEVGRVIHSDGSIVRYLDENLLQILQPNSNVITKQKDGQWIAVNGEGLKTSINKAKKQTKNIRILNENNPEIRKITIEREDLVSILIDNNHAVLYYPDGTKMKVGCKASESKLVDESGNYRLHGPYSICIEKHGLATVSFDSENSNQSLVLPNNVRVKRGEKSDGKTTENYLFLEQGKYSCEVDSFGSLKMNERITVGKNTTYKTLLNLNWITGQFDLIDDSGNAFNISPNGDSTVTKVELAQHNYAKAMSFPVGKNLSSLVQGVIDLPSKIPGNIPRFFMIRKDGSGIELLRDETIIDYFKDRLKDKKVEVIEEVLSELQNDISFITIQPLNSETLMYRNLVRFSPLSTDVRKKIMASLTKYENWKNTQDENSAKYINFPVTKEKLDISLWSDIEEKTKEPYLSIFRKELEAKILKKFAPGEMIYRRAIVLDNQKSDTKRLSIWTKPRLSRTFDKDLNEIAPKPRKTSIILPNKVIKDFRDIPCYFNSPEGEAYVALPVKMKQADVIEESLEEYQNEYIQDIKAPDQDIKAPDQDIKARDSTLQKDQTEIIDCTVSEKRNDTYSDDIKEAQNVEVLKQKVIEAKIPFDPLKIDVYGSPRLQKVPLPNAIKLTKPGAIPNEKFLSLEAKTKRIAKSVSSRPFEKKGVQYMLGTFEVLPSKAKFGILRQGNMYQTIINLVNVGLDSTRFRIKSPKSKRLSINYRKGPVAPGMKVALEIIIDATNLDSDEAYRISEDLQIVSESEYLYVPVSAEIHSADSSKVERIRPHIKILSDFI